MSLSALFIILSAVVADPGSGQNVLIHDLTGYLPASDAIQGWTPVDHPQSYSDDGLYQLIDGGAVIYYEYGFTQVITQIYENVNGKQIVVELYEMKTTSAAYGMFTFKTGTHSDTVDIGTEASLEDYYLNFWKGRFVITLIGYDTTDQCREELVSFARVINDVIAQKGIKPPLVSLLIGLEPKPEKIGYIKGNIGLSKYYTFNKEDIFGFTEGAVADYGNFSMFVFRYHDEQMSIARFGNVKTELKQNTEFECYTENKTSFSFKDKQGAYVIGKHHNTLILVYVGSKDDYPEALINDIETTVE